MIHAPTPTLIDLHRRTGDAGLLRALSKYSVGQATDALSELSNIRGAGASNISSKLSGGLLANSTVVISVLDQEYPACLRELDRDAPPLLYVTGSVERLKARSIAIIGTRNPASMGRGAARTVSEFVAGADWCVVSGNAPGVDAAAHHSAVAGGGETLIFPPCPMDQYKQCFRGKFPEQITVASCFAPGIAVEPWMFLRRNTLVAKHCQAAFVAETGTRGGTLDTVRKLRKFRKDIYATDFAETETHFKAHALLAASGATLIDVSTDSTQLLSILRSAEDCLRRPAVATHVLDDLFPEEFLNDE